MCEIIVRTGIPTSVTVDNFHVRLIMNTKDPKNVTRFLKWPIFNHISIGNALVL